MDNGGGGLSSAGAVQVEVPVQPSPVGGATTFKHGTTIPPQKTRTDGQQLTYPKWCALLVSNVLKTRTSFASYLNKSIFLSQAKNRFGLAPTFFPIPLPPGDHFDRMPANLSQHRRRTFHLKRAVHTLCMALNFWYNGGSFADVELLQREPNDQHRCLYGRLAALIRSEGLTQPFPVAKSGRKFPNLIARLGELSDVLMKQGAIDPYTKSFAGGDFTLDEETSGCLSPYRDLDPSRLALHGCGNWDATSYLSDYLVMAYREPRVLLTGLEAGVRPAVRDPPEKIGELARKWDANNLLMVHDEPVHPDSFVKIFNCYKNATTDRQIGDRRGQNSLESRLLGPSRELPGGADVQDLVADARSQKLCLSVTDRRDFYHQLFATRSRAVSNTVGPGVPWSMLEGTKGYANYLLASSRKKKASPEARGDFLGSYGWPPSQRSYVRPDEGLLWVSFCSVLQGDHGGVEICTDAHVSLLQSHGLLDVDSRLVSSKPLLGSSVADGLVIDDYFCISRENATTPNEESVAYARYEASQAAYREHGLLGSPQKDVLAENEGKAIGAYINSSERARSRGFITVASPPEKRLSLSFLTLQACALSHTTDSLHLCIVGGWVSALNYRRPLMSLMGKCFHVVDAAAYDPNEPKVVPLSRAVANELVLLAVLAPLALHEISARYDPDVYATDASNTMGGICKARVGEEVVETLWRHCKSKGAYTRLLSQAEVLMRRLELHEEGRDEPTIGAVQRPLAYSFDFIEVFAGSAKVTTYVAQLGVAVGPPLELSLSEEFNVSNEWVLRWISHLICQRLVKSFAIEPPCTTFSIMRRPRLRSRQQPLGFNTGDAYTRNGNFLACRAGQACRLAARYRVAALWETPFSSYMRHLPAWKAVSRLPHSSEIRCDSCRFGSPHLKSFRFLLVNADPRPLMLRCQCTSKHLQIAGSYTKESAVYVDALASTIASVLVNSSLVMDAVIEEENSLRVGGLENQLVNEVAIAAPWEVVASWTFRKPSHINILEEAVLLRLVNRLGRRSLPSRIVALVDSHVVRGATSKGRTSSRALSSVLRRVCAGCVAYGLYLVLPFCPTRLNVSDDPSRGVPLRPSSEGIPLSSLSKADLQRLAASSGFRRFASNWVRLVIRLLGLCCLDFPNRNIYPLPWPDPVPHLGLSSSMDFDATLGFPGEGPLTLHLALSSFGFLYLGMFFPSCWVLCCFAAACWGGRFGAFAMDLRPVTAGDRVRAAKRLTLGPLPSGRPVLAKTGSQREKYFAYFLRWVSFLEVDFEAMLDRHYENIEDINLILSHFGREIYKSGRTFNQYAETINELASRKPALRRMLQAAWDLGYSWKRHEPSEHHVALPSMVLLAMLSTCITWGWLRLAGCLSLLFGGLLRPGELCAATRGDLLLPDDLGGALPFCLLSIKEPKTRFSNARHQSAKVACGDLLLLIRLAFRKIGNEQRLWPFSPQTLRTRLKTLLEALWLPSESVPGRKAIDLGAFRAGGATWIIQSTEDGDLLQRRGRWANRKMMEIYVQEVSATLFLKRVPDATRERILALAGAFPALLKKALEFEAASIPTTAWYILLSQ